MRSKIYGSVVLTALLAQGALAEAQMSSNVEVYYAGLNNPRGLRFHGNKLFVAEAGQGGTNQTIGQCEQTPPPLGPFRCGNTGRVSAITGGGKRLTVVDGLPSSQTQFGDILGATDIEFVGQKLHILLQAGCSKGSLDYPNSVVVRHGNRLELVADLSSYNRAFPSDFPADNDDDPEGNPYSFKALPDGSLVVVEANHTTVDRIALDGSITRIADLAVFTQGHYTPVAVDVDRAGNLYVGSFGKFPYLSGTSDIHKITPGGHVSVYAGGFTTLIDLALDRNGVLYVLETSTGHDGTPPFLRPGTGRVTRLVGGQVEVVATGLDRPTAMTFGPDDYLYVANRGHGVGATPGQGEIVRIDVRRGLQSCDADASCELP